jgi:hypothetical protein
LNWIIYVVHYLQIFFQPSTKQTQPFLASDITQDQVQM